VYINTALECPAERGAAAAQPWRSLRAITEAVAAPQPHAPPFTSVFSLLALEAARQLAAAAAATTIIALPGCCGTASSGDDGIGGWGEGHVMWARAPPGGALEWRHMVGGADAAHGLEVPLDGEARVVPLSALGLPAVVSATAARPAAHRPPGIIVEQSEAFVPQPADGVIGPVEPSPKEEEAAAAAATLVLVTVAWIPRAGGLEWAVTASHMTPLARIGSAAPAGPSPPEQASKSVEFRLRFLRIH
jgi:hypothetical protein